MHITTETILRFSATCTDSAAADSAVDLLTGHGWFYETRADCEDVLALCDLIDSGLTEAEALEAFRAAVAPTVHDRANVINAQITAEGWNLRFTTGTDDAGDYRIERDDEKELFPNDPAAWAHVVARALAGSEPHRTALAFIKAENATEWGEILKAQPDAESASS